VRASRVSTSPRPAAGQRGVTLIELMIAIVILGILTAVAVPSYQQYIRRGERQTGAACLIELSQRMQVFHQRQGSYPTTLAQVGHDGVCPDSRYTLAIVNPPRTQNCGSAAAPVAPATTCGDGTAPRAVAACATAATPRFQLEALPNAAQQRDGSLQLTRCFSGQESRYRSADDERW